MKHSNANEDSRFDRPRGHNIHHPSMFVIPANYQDNLTLIPFDSRL